MTQAEREWIREGFRRAITLPGPRPWATAEHMAWYYIVGWMSDELLESTPPQYHDGGGIF